MFAFQPLPFHLHMSSKCKQVSVQPKDPRIIDATPDVTSVTESSSTSKSKTSISNVWKFLDKVKIAGITYLQCKATPKCNTKYKQVGSSTSNMKQHMKTAHHSLWSKLEDTSNAGPMDRFLKQSQLPEEFNGSNFRDLLAEWIVYEDQPFTATESNAFW